jgi:hypothetical protein
MNRLSLAVLTLVSVAALVSAAMAATAADEKVLEPFNGKNLDGWKLKGPPEKSFWCVGSAAPGAEKPNELVVGKEGNELVNAKEHGLDMYCEAVYGDAVITLEVMVPKGSNSGIYVHGEYEIQVLDSYGKEKNPGGGDMGAVYGAQPPRNPVYKKPGEWSTYEIHWQAPRFDADGKKTANAKLVKVVLNGAVIHENLELPGPTPGGVDGKEKARGPLMFQGNHGPVSYRNIKIKCLN